MIKISTYTILGFLLLFLVGCQEQECIESDLLIEEVKQRSQSIIPDKRVGVRDIELEELNCDQLKGVIRSDNQNLLTQIEDFLSESMPVDSIEFVYLPSQKLQKDTFGVVNISVANIRTQPKHSAELTTQALLGTEVKVLDKNGEWFRIQTPDNYIAWVDEGGIELMDAAQVEQWSQKEKVYVNVINSELKNIDNHVMSDLVFGNILALDGSLQGRKLSVEMPDGRSGYVDGADVILLEHVNPDSKLTYDEMIETAMKLMGRPYLWGGTSVKGMDCSGFTKTLLWDQGFIFPRDASQQVYVGYEVPYDDSLSQVEQGDPIYFGTLRDDGSERITHVALYMGDGEIIHATGRVKIENLLPGRELFNEERYKTILQIRRLIGHENTLKHIYE